MGWLVMKEGRDVMFGEGHSALAVHTVHVPKGHPVELHGRNGDGSPALFAKPRGLDIEPGSIAEHDATYYGIRIRPEWVEEPKPCDT